VRSRSASALRDRWLKEQPAKENEEMMGRTPALSLFVIAAATFSCSGPVAVNLLEEAGSAPTAFELANATYSGIVDLPVTLTDGRWEGEPFVEGGASRPTVGLVDSFILTGDLDQDGHEETAALLWENSGGSGNRVYLAVMARRNGDIVNFGTSMIGDRVQIRSGAIDDGRVTLDLIRAGPEDAACCPTEKALVTWVCGEDGLSRSADETTGTLSIADLEGHGWRLIELGRGHSLPEGIEISMVFRDDRVSGNSGCNDYFAGVTAPRPGELGFNGMGATRMACPEPLMDLERHYLSTLAGASGYSFLAGRLVLSCDTDEGPQALVFTPWENPTGTPAEIRK
jgi:heat shock protein HslJ